MKPFTKSLFGASILLVAGALVFFGQAPTAILGTDQPKNSRTVINTNFSNLYTQVQQALAGIQPTTRLNTTVYNFAAQTPGGTLAGTVGSSVTLTPCPLGVNGSDAGHKLYITGGTGTAEAILITGGTCTSGATTGTVLFTPANSHSGSWTIKSATNGAQEAAQVIATAGTGGEVVYPAGVFSNCGQYTNPGQGIVISGAGSGGAGVATNLTTLGTTATVIRPCVANQTLFSSTGVTAYGSTANYLSMRDIGFQNNGLSGITAIALLHDASGVFNNLTFSGTVSAFTAFNGDRVWNTSVTNVFASGTAGAYFGSTIDGTGEWTYSTVIISNWNYSGVATSLPVIRLSRCVGCVISHARATDINLTATGTGFTVENDSQGVVLDDVNAEGFLYGIRGISTTVGSTTQGPGWLTLSGDQVDCAGGSACLNNAFVLIDLNGAYNVTIRDAILSAVSTVGVGIKIVGAVGVTTTANIIGGFFTLTQSYDLQVAGGTNGISVVGTTMVTGSPSYFMLLSGGSAVNNMYISQNHFNGSAQFINTSGGTTLATSLSTGNFCAIGTTGSSCNALLYNQLPAPAATNSGTFQFILDSTTNTWGATVASGGANLVGAVSNGTNWTVASK